MSPFPFKHSWSPGTARSFGAPDVVDEGACDGQEVGWDAHECRGVAWIGVATLATKILDQQPLVQHVHRERAGQDLVKCECVAFDPWPMTPMTV